jgi:hypothetical protein
LTGRRNRPKYTWEVATIDTPNDDLSPVMFPPSIGLALNRSDETVRNWIKTGVRTADGSRHKLAGTRIGGRWGVSPAALTEFLILLNPTSGKRLAAMIVARVVGGTGTETAAA